MKSLWHKPLNPNSFSSINKASAIVVNQHQSCLLWQRSLWSTHYNSIVWYAIYWLHICRCFDFVKIQCFIFKHIDLWQISIRWFQFIFCLVVGALLGSCACVLEVPALRLLYYWNRAISLHLHVKFCFCDLNGACCVLFKQTNVNVICLLIWV